jgi:hypothetical protein
MKSPRRILLISGSVAALAGVVFYLGWFEQALFALAALLVRHSAKPSWPLRLHQAGMALFGLGLALLVAGWALPHWQGFKPRLLRLGRRFGDWRERRVGQWIAYERPPQPVKFSWPAFHRVDWIIVGLFLVYSLLIFTGQIQGNFPNFLLSGDAGNTASFAAGFDHPDLFRPDMLLGQTSNFAIYSTFNVYFMRWLAPSVGSYALALTLLVPLQVFFFLAGFYLFGRILFGSPLWAAAFCALLAFPVAMNLGERWGLSIDPVARFNFQAFLPFVLCMALVWRDRPARWPWIMAATGLLFYLHPVSTPTWAAAIWLGLWFSTPRGWTFWKRLGVMVGMGLIFLAVASPYILTYFSSHVQGASPSYDLVYKIISDYMPANLINVPGAVGDFVGLMLRSGLLPLAALGLVLDWVFLRPNRRLYGLVFAWLLGILLTAILLPWAMHTYERIAHLVPTETELVRGVRYFIPFLLLFCLWPVYQLSRAARSRKAAIGITALALVGVAAWGLSFPPPVEPVSRAVTCLAQGKLVCVQASEYEKMLQVASQEVPPGAPIYVTFSDDSLLSYGMPVRYSALHPLVYAYKDRSQLVYSNHQTLSLWYETYQAVDEIERDVADPQTRFTRHLELARSLGARYMITHFDFELTGADLAQVSVVYAGPVFKILEIH